MTAGSRWTRLARMGRKQPSSLDTITVTISVKLTTRATEKARWLSSISLARFTTARVMPHSRPTRISFQATRIQSQYRISPRERPRITVTEDWLPQFPPVSMSMGIKAVSTTWAARADS